MDDKPPISKISTIPAGWSTVMKPLRRNRYENNGIASSGNDPDSKDVHVTEERDVVKTGEEDSGGLQEVRSYDDLLPAEAGESRPRSWALRRHRSAVENGNTHHHDVEHGNAEEGEHHVVYRVYKRRFFGLVQLSLLNIMISWDWITFSPVSTTATDYLGISITDLNWLSTSVLFAFVIAAPFTIWVLNRGGPRGAILIASVLLLIGNWIRYGGTLSKNYGAILFGQILTGLAQPFVLSAPTRYSDLWFTGDGRVAATAIMSLANPFGAALGQLINPFLATESSQIPNMVLIIAIISTVATIPSLFVPAKPPTPPSHASSLEKQPLLESIKTLIKLPEFYMIFAPFAIYVGLFNSISTLLNQILEPFGFSEAGAGIGGAVLIVAGLVAAGITSPVIDKYKCFLLAVKILVPLEGLLYLAFIWAPPTASFAPVYIILGALGAASFSLVPVVLEYMVEVTFPVSPEVTSTICWSGGQLLGGIFIVVSTQLTDGPEGGAGGTTPFNMQRALVLQAVLALIIVPVPLALNCCGRRVKNRRSELDRDDEGNLVSTGID